MAQELSKDRLKQYNAARAQNLLTEYGEFIKAIVEETIAEYSLEINGHTADEIAIAYSRNQGARQGLLLLMKKINSKANE